MAVFMSAREVAARYGLTKETVYRMAYVGTMPPGIRLGRMRRWALPELEAWEQDLQKAALVERDQRQKEALARAMARFWSG